MSNQIANDRDLLVTGQTFPSNECPSTPADLHALFSTHTTVQARGAVYISSQTEPTVSDHDKLWLRLDSNNIPFALYFRNITSARWEPANGVPIGSVQPFAGATTPHGWLLCDGQDYDSALPQYDMIYAALGSTYNIGGEAAGFFRVPDMRGRVVAGKDDMGGAAAARLTNPAQTIGGIDGSNLGGSGGSELHVLTVDQMPEHNHTYDQPVPNDAGRHSGGHDQDVVSGQPTSNTGGGDAHNNVQPTIILNYIIRYL